MTKFSPAHASLFPPSTWLASTPFGVFLHVSGVEFIGSPKSPALAWPSFAWLPFTFCFFLAAEFQGFGCISGGPDTPQWMQLLQKAQNIGTN